MPTLALGRAEDALHLLVEVARCHGAELFPDDAPHGLFVVELLDVAEALVGGGALFAISARSSFAEVVDLTVEGLCLRSRPCLES
jgi:hypothetical protein